MDLSIKVDISALDGYVEKAVAFGINICNDTG